MPIRNLYSILLAIGALGAMALTGCGGSSSRSSTTPTQPTLPPPVQCANVSGAWHTSWVMTCGPDTQGAGDIVVSQSGCAVTFGVPGLGTFSGTLEGNQSKPNLSLQFAATAPGASAACGNSSEGGLRIQTDGHIEIPFGTDPPPCCRHGAVEMRR